MTIQNIIDLAQNGPLKNVSVKSDVDSVIGYINLGLIELYKRFPMDTAEVILTLGSDGDDSNPYTMVSDTIYQMPDDFMYLIAAYDELPEDSLRTSSEIPINEEENVNSINTISWNKIQIPESVVGAHISLIYASSPVYFTSADLSETVPLPMQMIEALLAYLGYQGHASVSVAENENNIHYQRFEASCAKVKELGIFTSDDLNMNLRWSNRGFV